MRNFYGQVASPFLHSKRQKHYNNHFRALSFTPSGIHFSSADDFDRKMKMMQKKNNGVWQGKRSQLTFIKNQFYFNYQARYLKINI